jgi:hypothetical protein
MKLITTLAAILAISCSASAIAQCGGAKAKDGEAKAVKAGDKAGCAKSCADKAKVAGECTGAPKMVYKIGDETTCCDKTAAEMAKKAEKPIVYVVAGKDYSDQVEAMTAWRDALETYVDGMTTVRFAVGSETLTCPMAAESVAKEKNAKVAYRVASMTFESKEDAEKAAKAAAEAAETVSMKMVVDGKEVKCDKTAEKACSKGAKTSGATCHKDGKDAKAAEKGEPSEFIVGEYKTKCPIDARVHLAQARIEAAMKALEQSGGKADASANSNDRG